MEIKSIRYVRLAEALNRDIVTYLNDKNLFYASSWNNDTGSYDEGLTYAYNNGNLIRMK